jgi:DNA-binding transcriptional LysR family regulator
MDRLTGLQVFVRVVETGSFSRAANDLGLTQPTVTKHVSELERRLGARLLNRNSRGVGVTEIGSLYFQRCKLVLREFEATETIVNERRGDLVGPLRVGASMAFGRNVIAPLVFEFLKQHRRLKIDLSCEDRYVDVVAHGLDMAIRLGKLADSSLGCRCIGSNPWVMTASNAYLDTRGEPQAPGELAAHDCLIYSTVQGDEVWRLADASGNESVVGVNGPLKSNNLSILLSAARAGMGVAILPMYLAADPLRSGELRILLADHVLPKQEINVVFPSPRFVPAKVLALIAFLQQHFRGEWWNVDLDRSSYSAAE